MGYIATIIYLLGVFLAYKMLKKAYIEWVYYGDKSKWDMNGVIMCLLLCWGSWFSFLIAIIMCSACGGFKGKPFKWL